MCVHLLVFALMHFHGYAFLRPCAPAVSSGRRRRRPKAAGDSQQLVCLIELVDTWQYQRLDLRKFFKEPNFYPNGEIEAKDGDKLKFEIIDVYKGTKYKDTGLSEFVFESPGN